MIWLSSAGVRHNRDPVQASPFVAVCKQQIIIGSVTFVRIICSSAWKGLSVFPGTESLFLAIRFFTRLEY